MFFFSVDKVILQIRETAETVFCLLNAGAFKLVHVPLFLLKAVKHFLDSKMTRLLKFP